MTRKNLKVSEIVHEELEVRKRRDESFDDVLKRDLGILPETVEDLTTYYPDELHEVVTYLAGFLNDDDLYHQFVTDHDDYFALNYDSKESGRTIIRLKFSNNPPEVEICYRNERGELESIGQLIQQSGEDFAITDIELLHSDSGITIGSVDAFDGVDEELEDALHNLQESAYERWG